MPDIDRTVDIKVTAGKGTVMAVIPLAGHASEHWLELFRMLAAHREQELHSRSCHYRRLPREHNASKA